LHQSASPPSVIDGKYQLLRQLGEGGMGTVFEARHRGTGRLVAVKLIADGAAAGSADIVRRFQREAMATGAIQSQYIAHALDTGIDPQTGSPYLVMDLLDGEDLQHSIASLGALPPELALRIAAQTCLGLQKAHEAGVVHRDIKPGNLFLAKREGTEIVVKLLDFGIAKVKMESITSAPAGQMTRTGSMLGSPVYMSPEQARGKKTIDHRTDLWSLGVVLYEALAGVTPHAGAETLGDLIFQICGEPPRPIQEPAPRTGSPARAICSTRSRRSCRRGTRSTSRCSSRCRARRAACSRRTTRSRGTSARRRSRSSRAPA
jgi:serine/threonine-protein kinase